MEKAKGILAQQKSNGSDTYGDKCCKGKGKNEAKNEDGQAKGKETGKGRARPWTG